jgi:phosphoribosylamine--glycine ligase
VRRACVIGTGAREHAIAHVLSRTAAVVAVPGSDGMAADGIEVSDGSPVDVEADLYVVGPEQPLVDGLADRLRASGRLVVGPGADGARLEGSKSFMKELLADAGVPTARHGTFDDAGRAAEFIGSLGTTIVVKTDGLAAGKGVLVTDDVDKAIRDATAKLDGTAFGDAGRRVVIEEGLEGDECTLLVLVDGTSAVALAPSRDYKRLFDADRGPNTGGMGAVSPAPGVDAGVVDRVMTEAITPTLAELRRRGIEYRGVLYAGVMLTPSGPRLLEYNVRFGDPEAQVVLPRLADDLYDLLVDVASGTLQATPRFVREAAVTVVLASPGYPDTPRSGQEISGLAEDGQLVGRPDGVHVYHAATRREAGRFVTAGGRVLSVTALGASVSDARARAYDAIREVRFDGVQVRTDVGALPAEVLS